MRRVDRFIPTALEILWTKERMYKSGNLLVMQHFAFDDDRRRLLRPSVISDDAISVLNMPRSPPGVCPFRFLCDETSLEFNNFTAKRETSLRRTNRNNNFVFIYLYIYIFLFYFLSVALIKTLGEHCTRIAFNCNDLIIHIDTLTTLFFFRTQKSRTRTLLRPTRMQFRSPLYSFSQNISPVHVSSESSRNKLRAFASTCAKKQEISSDFISATECVCEKTYLEFISCIERGRHALLS